MKLFNKNPKKKNKPEPRPIPETSLEDEMLSEFSDDYNEFYVDEAAESRRAETEERPERPERRDRPDRRSSRRRARRKPVSPVRRKLIRILSTVAIVAVIIIIGVVLSLTVLFKTQSYQVIGNTLYLEADIIDTCGIKEGENIFLAAKRPAEERIVNRFPYVESAHVSFSIPDTIKIEITEAAEGYLFKVSDSEYLIISTKGRVLNRISDKSGYNLPIFIGPKLKSGEIGQDIVYEDDTVLSIIDSIAQVFADNGYQGITEVDATDTANITFTYDGRIKVKLGIPEAVSYKIRTAMTIINGNIDVNPNNKPTGVLDVSRCNATKRSYFREGEINPTEAPTQDPSQPATEKPDDGSSGEDWSDDDYSDGDYSDDEYSWNEGDWNDDGNVWYNE